MAEDRTPRTVSPTGEPVEDDMRPSPKRKTKARAKEIRLDEPMPAGRRKTGPDHNDDRLSSRII